MSLFQKTGETLCSIRTASGVLTLTQSGKTTMGFLDRSCLVASDSPTKFMSTLAPVLWRIAVPEMGSGFVRASVSDKKVPKSIDEFLKGMENDRGVKVVVLEDHPDESVENTPRECQATNGSLTRNVHEYGSCICSAAESLMELQSLSDSLLCVKLPESMWGIKDVNKVLAGVRADMNDQASNETEIISETTGKKVRLAMTALGNSGVKDSFLTKIMSDMINDFFSVKNKVSKTVGVLYPLFSIDKIFKKATGYPTTWAFDPSTFYDFQYCYDGLVKKLVRLAKLEMSAIEPMFIWKVKTGA